MIHVTIFAVNHQYTGFICEGHAGYAEEGSDIICSAVSVLAINTINSLELLTEDDFTSEQARDGGFLKVMLTDEISDDADLLMRSFVLGLQTVQEEYGEEYLTVTFEDDSSADWGGEVNDDTEEV